MTELTIFSVNYLLVFALGFQSRNVNEGHYTLAFLTNAVIGVMNAIILKLVPAADSWTTLVAYVSGGPLGIVSAMWVHHHVIRKRHR